MSAGQDGWTVVRGKCKDRSKGGARSGRVSSSAVTTSAAAAAGTAGPNNGSAGPNRAPGHTDPWASCGPFSKHRGVGVGGRGGGARERTSEEQCEHLLSAIRDCRQEVAASPFYTRLLEVMSEAGAAHLGCMPYASALEGSSVDGGGDGGVSGSGSGGSVFGGGGGGGDGGELGGVRHWRCMRSVVVYGLGSPHLSRVSRYQLALILLLRDQLLSGLTSAVQLYDPAFDDVDRLVLQQLGLQVVEVDEGAARRVAEPTLFYMPHCEGGLYDALLRANWVRRDADDAGMSTAAATGSSSSNIRSGLPLLAVLGNSFAEYLERWEMRRAGSGGAGGGSNDAHNAHRGHPLGTPGPVVRCCLEDAVAEIATPDLRFPVPSAFNSMSLHLFPPSHRLERMLETGPDVLLGGGRHGDMERVTLAS